MSFETERRNVGEGWQPLITETHQKITAIYPDYAIFQIKEKFGGLRYYIDAVPSELFEQVNAIITEAEERSFTICENCGADGSVGTTEESYWIRTLCDTCRASFAQEQRERREQAAREARARGSE